MHRVEVLVKEGWVNVCVSVCVHTYSHRPEEVTPDKPLSGEIIALDTLVRRGGEKSIFSFIK